MKHILANKNDYTIICGRELFEIMHIMYDEYEGKISKEECNLKVRAVYDKAYLHPNWDYLKYPAVDLDNPYPNIVVSRHI